jgi:hypothetical protein
MVISSDFIKKGQYVYHLQSLKKIYGLTVNKKSR